MNELTTQEKLKETANQIHDLVNHGFVQSRLILVTAYHEVGQLIMAFPTKYTAVKDLARLNGVSERTLYSCAKFYEKYPDFATVPEGNNISWNKILTKYLPDTPSKEAKALHECPLCGNKHTYDPNQIQQP